MQKHHTHLILGILIGLLTAITLYGLAYENARITNIENFLQQVTGAVPAVHASRGIVNPLEAN